MRRLSTALKTAAASAALLLAGAAQAATLDIDLAGFKAFADFDSALNTQIELDIGIGTQVLGFSYRGLSFETANDSFLNELMLSVQNLDGSEFMDWQPSDVDDVGSASGLAGSWVAGATLLGAPFTVADGKLIVRVYDRFDNAGDELDAGISAGTLTLRLEPVAQAVPEPAGLALLALGALAVVSRRRRG